MSQINAATVPSGGVFNLKVDVTSSELTPTLEFSPVSALINQETGELYTELVVNVGAKRKDSTTGALIGERTWCTGGVIVENSNGDEVARFTGAIRGLSNVFDAVPVAADSIEDNIVAHSEGETCTIAADWLFRQQAGVFASNTTQINNAISGEAFIPGEQLSLHTDGKHYKYDSVLYPNWRGTAGFTATAADEVGIVYLPGYIVTGYSGLTVGGSVYADDGGTTVQTSTATSTFIGYADSATSVRLQSTAPSSLEKASTAEAEAGTDDAKYMTPLKTVESIIANSPKEFLMTAFRLVTGAFKAIFAGTFTADRTFTLPDKSGTVATTADIPVSSDVMSILDADNGSTSTNNAIIPVSENIDSLNEFTGGVFTATNAGTYLIGFGGDINTIFNEESRIEMQVNAVTEETVKFASTGTTGQNLFSTCSATRILELAASDEVRLIAALSSGTSISNAFLNIQRIK